MTEAPQGDGTLSGNRLAALKAKQKAIEEKKRPKAAPPLTVAQVEQIRQKLADFKADPRARGLFAQSVNDFVMVKLFLDMESGELDGEEFRRTAKQFHQFMSPLAAAGVLTPTTDDSEDEDEDE